MAKRSKRKRKGGGRQGTRAPDEGQARTEPKTETAPESATESATEPASAPETEPASAPETESAPEPEPEAEPEPETESAPGSESETGTGRIRAGLSAFVVHLHPPRVRRRSMSMAATLGLGLATLVCLGLVTVSGILLAFHYVPATGQAHGSLQDLLSVVPAGRFMRNLHRWSAHGAVLCCVLHMLRVLLWGSYRAGHARVWLVGVGLLVTVVATSFSGYLLPWDQDAYWTVTVGTSLAGYVPLVGDGLSRLLLGATEVGQATLTRFFMLHVLLLPTLGLVLLVLHLFRLRRAGGLARPAGARGPGEEPVPASHLVSREVALTLLVTTVLVLLATLVDAHLGPAPDMVRPDNPPKAPWFLVGLQEMVGYSAPLGGFVFPTLLLLLLALGPWLDGKEACDGTLLPRASTRVVLPGLVVLVAGVTIAGVLWWGDPQQGAASWLNPASIAAAVAAAAALSCWLVARRRSLAYRGLVLGLIAVLAVLTAVGWFWRGPDWTLTYHPGPGRHAAVDSGGDR